MAKDATLPAVKKTATSGNTHLMTTVLSPSTNRYWPNFASKDDIPAWLRDNDYILTGHPLPTYSYKRSFRLWRCLHMETMNIWTHLVGSLAFIAAGITMYNYSVSQAFSLSVGDKFAFGISITAASLCFAMSTAFHTLRSHSYNVHHFWGKLDIFGICLLALGGGASATYYVFICDPRSQWIYWGLNSCAAIGAAILLFDTGGGGNKMRTLRGGTFVLLALTAMLPIFHGIGRLGWSRACEEIGAGWYLAEGVILSIGVSLFVSRLPEKLSPGTFDVWGHSHQLHHICAVAGTGCHVAALVTSYKYRQAHPKC